MTKNENPINNCSFCGRTEDMVEKLIAGPNAFICDKCIDLCVDVISQKDEKAQNLNLKKPKEIKKHLDEYIIG